MNRDRRDISIRGFGNRSDGQCTGSMAVLEAARALQKLA